MESLPTNDQLTWRQKAIIVTCGLVVVLSVISLWYLDFYYYAYGSRVPLATEGRIYLKWVHHGTRVYLTQQEYLPFQVLPTLCGVFTLLGAYLTLRWKRSL